MAATVKTYYAEDVNYWETSNTGSDTWIDNAEGEITSIGGRICERMYGRMNEREGFMLVFELPLPKEPDKPIVWEKYRMAWPVLKTRKGDKQATARKQAATALFHDVKTRVVAAKFMGARTAFFAYLMLPDGRTLGEISSVELMQAMPKSMIAPYHTPPALMLPPPAPTPPTEPPVTPAPDKPEPEIKVEKVPEPA